MRVVVTGGAGFIGSHCVDLLLERGHDVIVVDDFSVGLRDNLVTATEIARRTGRKLEVVEASVVDPGLWKSRLGSAEALFHLSAQTSVTASLQNPAHDFQANVAPTLPILEWAQDRGCRALVYANTAGALYGDADAIPTDERAPLRPVSPYGATKAFFEIYLRAYAAGNRALGRWSASPSDSNYCTWASLRLSNVYGPRQRTTGEAGVVPIFVEALAQGRRPVVYGAQEATRDYVHVADVATAFLAALDRMVQVPLDDVFNVSSATETSAIEVFDHVLDALVERAHAEGGNQGPLKAALGIRDAYQRPLRPGEVKRSCLDNRKAQSYLAWKPRMSLEAGIRGTVRDYPL